ncbi:TerC family protein [Neobacillus vireti]|uniref:TerC family protein n=1 Tax=Neobacillus vireti TaxID=220686 RepID=UPI002FFD7B4B
MTEVAKVFFITLVSDIDNLLILGTILRRYTHLKITLPAIIVLTLSRAIYVIIIKSILGVPMLQLSMGIILLLIAFKLVRKSIDGEPLTRPFNQSIFLKIKVLSILAATDFLICLDSVVIIVGISQHVEAVTLGIFSSLLVSLLFLPFVVKLATSFFWINIIAGAFIAQNAVIGMLKDPILAGWLSTINKLFPHTNVINMTANGAIIIFIVIGVYSYIKHQRIIFHKWK